MTCIAWFDASNYRRLFLANDESRNSSEKLLSPSITVETKSSTSNTSIIVWTVCDKI